MYDEPKINLLEAVVRFFLALVIFIIMGYFKFTWELINKYMVIGDSIAGIIAGVVLYWILNYYLIKKPKVRLYTENNSPKIIEGKNEFKLKFYINNKSNSAAKNMRLTAEFYNLEILKGKRADGEGFRRLDFFGLRSNPSIQFDYFGIHNNIVYNYPDEKNTYIGEILFKIKEPSKKIWLKYDIVAENMSYFKHEYEITPIYIQGV